MIQGHYFQVYNDPKLCVLHVSLSLDYVKSDGYPQSCDEVKQRGNTASGGYTISPAGGQDSFTVYCDMSTTPPTHVLHHNEETVDTLVDGPEYAGDYRKTITYNNDVSWAQARSLVAHSESCFYSYQEQCVGSIMTGYTFWEAYNGQSVHDLVGTTDTLCRGRCIMS